MQYKATDVYLGLCQKLLEILYSLSQNSLNSFYEKKTVVFKTKYSNTKTILP